MAQGEYTSEFTGEQIDALLEKVDQRVSTPAPAEDKLITSGGVYTGLAGKTDKVTSPTAGNLPKLKADGSLEDSGKKTSDFVEKEEGKGLSTNDYTNEDKTKLGALPTKADLDTELDAKEDKDNKVISFSNPTDTQYPSAKLVSDSLNKVKADVSSLLTKAGIAEGIADTLSAGTAQEFLQRQSGGDGVNCIKRIKGKTIAWNQLVQNGDFTSKSSWGTYLADYSVSGNIATITTSAAGGAIFQDIPVVAGHKYYIAASVKSDGASQAIIGLQQSASGTVVSSSSSSWARGSIVVTAGSQANIRIAVSTQDAAGTLYAANIFCVDLTLATLSDLTAAQFEALYPLPYYAPASVLKSNDAAALLTDGRNQWDEVWGNGALDNNGNPYAANNYIYSKNWIYLPAGQTYYFKSPANIQMRAFDANGTLILAGGIGSNQTFVIPSNCYRFKFFVNYGDNTYKNDICINLSDASFNGTYQPYWSRVLALRLSELTGIPEGGTEADRVTMFPNGAGGAGSAFDSIFVENGITKARKTMLAEVDLGTLDWSREAVYLEQSKNHFIGSGLGSIIRKPVSSSASQDWAICSNPYTEVTSTEVNYDRDKIFTVKETTGNIVINDFTYTSSTAEQFKTAMAGVKLLAEAATPIVYTDLQYADGTPFTMPATILVDDYGKEVIVPPTGATTPSAPFCCDSNYSISIANLVKRLNQ